jgi:anti-anti-sigma factor
VTSPAAHVERGDRPGAMIAQLHGDIDSSNAAEILLPLAAETAGRPLILTLDDVQYIDSAGMAALETLRRSSTLRIVMSRHSIIWRAMEIVGLDQLIPVFERLEDAMLNQQPAGGQVP